METIFFSIKDEKVKNVHPKFLIIPIIELSLNFCVKFAIQDGEVNKSNF